MTAIAANTESPSVYADIYEIPVSLRTYRSAKLSLAQINELVADAYAHMLKTEEGIRDTEIPDFGGAKVRFAASHHIEKGFWVNGALEETE